MSRISGYGHDGLTFDVLDEGPADGEVVVLLHGFPERATCWREVTPALHAAGLRTLTPDQRGYSPGARPQGRRQYRLDRLVADVVALVEQVGAPVHLVGHDWGAMVAWSVAQARPDLVRTLTAFSVPHPGAFLGSMRTSRQGIKSWYIGLFQAPRVAETLASRGLLQKVLRRGGMTADEVTRFELEIVDHGALPGGLAWYRALPWLDRAQAQQPVRVPTTMVWSEGDDFVGRAGVDATSRYVRAPYRLLVLPGVTHWIPTQAPGEAAAAILDRTGG